MFSKQIELAITIAELFQTVKEQAVTDSLTGLNNRRYFEEFLQKELLRAQRQNQKFTIVGIDLDHLKQINDKYGHLQGDLALRTVAGMLQSVLPKHWIIARYGGDEFLAAGRCQDTKTLEEFKAAMTERLAKEALENHLTFELTISVGGVTTQEEKDFTLEQYLRKADERMYEEKREHHKRKGV